MFQNIHNRHSKQKGKNLNKGNKQSSYVAGTNTNTGTAELIQHQISFRRIRTWLVIVSRQPTDFPAQKIMYNKVGDCLIH